MPLNEARLSSFLAVDKNASDTEREAFLSGQMIDLQGKLNVSNLLEGNSLSATALASFSRLFELLGLPKVNYLRWPAACSKPCATQLHLSEVLRRIRTEPLHRQPQHPPLAPRLRQARRRLP